MTCPSRAGRQAGEEVSVELGRSALCLPGWVCPAWREPYFACAFEFVGLFCKGRFLLSRQLELISLHQFSVPLKGMSKTLSLLVFWHSVRLSERRCGVRENCVSDLEQWLSNFLTVTHGKRDILHHDYLLPCRHICG